MQLTVRYFGVILYFIFFPMFSHAGAAVPDSDRLPELPDSIVPNLAELVSSGRTEQARLLVESISSSGQYDAASIALLQVRYKMLTGKADQALEQLQKIRRKYDYLSKYALQLMLRIHQETGDYKNALTDFNAIAGKSLSTQEAYLLLDIADLALQKKQYRTAEKQYLRILKQLRKGSGADRARLGLSKSRLGLNKENTAVKNLRYLQVHFRDPQLFLEAKKLENEIASRHNLPVQAFSESEYRELSERLIDRADYNQALNLLTEWEKRHPHTSNRDRIDLLRLQILVNKRENGPAYQAAMSFLNSHKKSSLAIQARHFMLVLLQRMGNTEELRKQATEIWKGKHGGSSSRRRSAAMLLAAYLVSSGYATEGLDLYRDIYRSGISRNLQNSILWRVGIGALRDNQNDRALANFRVLLRRKPKGDELLSSYYWIAEAEMRIGNNKNAIIYLLKIIQQEPWSYYGFLARTRLGSVAALVEADWLAKAKHNYQQKKLDFPELELSDSILKSGQYKAATALARAGFDYLLEEVATDLRNKFKGNQAVAYYSAICYRRAGNTWRSVQTTQLFFQKYIKADISKVPREILHLAYPRPFANSIVQAATYHELDELFMTSIMRQESRFNPEATSWVGARGLFQFMDYTAAELAPQIGIQSISARDLYDPVINISLAAYYQRSLFDLFENRIPPIVASYNAGEDRTLAWWRAAQAEEIPEDLFIDTIPYYETRNFVRSVLTNYFMYMRIY